MEFENWDTFNSFPRFIISLYLRDVHLSVNYILNNFELTLIWKWATTINKQKPDFRKHDNYTEMGMEDLNRLKEQNQFFWNRVRCSSKISIQYVLDLIDRYIITEVEMVHHEVLLKYHI